MPFTTMQRRSRFTLALALLCAVAPLAPQRARAQAPAPAPVAGTGDVAVAEGYAEQAFEAYRVRDYGRALSLYEQALAAAPSADILYNIARVYDVGLRNRRRAIEYYERYVAHTGAASDRRDTARQRLEELRAAERASQVSEAESIDAIARDFPVDTGESAPAPARPAPAAPPDTHGLHALEIGALALGSVGLVGIGLGVGFGLSAQSRGDTWQRDCNGNQCTSQRGVDAAQSAGRRADVATLGFAVGGGLIGIAAVLWMLDTDDERPPTTAGLELTPIVDGSRVLGSVRGHF